MSDDEPVLSDEAAQNLYDQMMDLYLADALEERSIDESEMRKAQILFLAPFKDGQFDGVRGGDSDVEVRINDEAEVIMTVDVDPESDIEAGDPVPMSAIEGFGDVVEIPDFGTDVGHVTFVRLPTGELLTAVDFVYNQSYIEPLIETADEFIATAEYARQNGLWRSFVENALHAAERMMKARVVQHGDAAYKHYIVEMNYRKYAEAGMANPALLEVFSKLVNDYRDAATYVDPGDHPDGADEKDFELNPGEADRILDVITEHRESIGP